MSTRVNERDAAIVSAAVLAFLGKPETVSPALISTEVPEHVRKMLTGLGEELKERIRTVEERVVRLEKTVDVIMSKVERMEKMEASPEKSVATHPTPTTSAWSLAGRSEFGVNGDVIRQVSKTASLWGLAGRYAAISKLRGKGRS